MTPVIKKEVSVKEEEQDDGFDSDDERELQRLIRENERIESERRSYKVQDEIEHQAPAFLNPGTDTANCLSDSEDEDIQPSRPQRSARRQGTRQPIIEDSTESEDETETNDTGSDNEEGSSSEEDVEIWCYCNRIEHGKMVACDNASCIFGWFHFDCVGIEAAPQGNWKCTACTRAAGPKLAGHPAAEKALGGKIHCLCRNAGFGRMVGCDNGGCTIKWFHCDCVGLEVKPKTWFCPSCYRETRKLFD